MFNNRKSLRCWFFKFKWYNKKWQDNIIHTIIWQLGQHGTTKCHRDDSTTQNICSFPFWVNCPNISPGNLTTYQKTNVPFWRWRIWINPFRNKAVTWQNVWQAKHCKHIPDILMPCRKRGLGQLSEVAALTLQA